MQIRVTGGLGFAYGHTHRKSHLNEVLVAQVKIRFKGLLLGVFKIV